MGHRIRTILLLVSFALGCLLPGGLHAAEHEVTQAPKFPRGMLWVNASKGYRPAYEDKLTLVYFWDYTSINCIREIQTMRKWRELYRPYGLEVIWVHSPEFAFAKNYEEVRSAVKRYGILDPVVLDNDFSLWEKFGNHSWPAKYLINGRGEVVYSQAGEEGYQKTETMIRFYLKSQDERVVLPEPGQHRDLDRFDLTTCGLMTGETYIGSRRAGWWGGKVANSQWLTPGETSMFKDRGERVDRGFFVHGKWTNGEDAFIHARETDSLKDYLGLTYIAHEVYAVLDPGKSPDGAVIYVTRDGEPVPKVKRGTDLHEDAAGRTYVALDRPRLYYLIQNENQDPHELRLWIDKEGPGINSFSFANFCLANFDHL